MDFIRPVLIRKIQDEVKELIEITDTNFLYFNNPVVDRRFGEIDRVNKWAPFGKDQISPFSFSLLEGKTLVDILEKLNNNKIHFYRFSGGGFQKIKLK